MDILLIAAILLLCVVIASEAMKIVSGIMRKHNSLSDSSIIIIPLKKNEPMIENKLRDIITQFSWDERITPKVLLVNLDADSETLNICYKLCDESDFVKICSPDNINAYLENTAFQI